MTDPPDRQDHEQQLKDYLADLLPCAAFRKMDKKRAAPAALDDSGGDGCAVSGVGLSHTSASRKRERWWMTSECHIILPCRIIAYGGNRGLGRNGGLLYSRFHYGVLLPRQVGMGLAAREHDAG